MIRLCQPADLQSLREICLRTGDSGQDATGLWSDDGLLPDVFLEPYVVLDSLSVWVAVQDDRPVGYLAATFDTRRFVERWSELWTPVFAARHGPTAMDPREQWLHNAGYDPSFTLNEHADGFPAHLHINLLPQAQGSGSGRALMRQLGLAASRAGVPGIHLGVSRSNAGARAFYARLGFRELSEASDAAPSGSADSDTIWLGINPEGLH